MIALSDRAAPDDAEPKSSAAGGQGGHAGKRKSPRRPTTAVRSGYLLFVLDRSGCPPRERPWGAFSHQLIRGRGGQGPIDRGTQLLSQLPDERLLHQSEVMTGDQADVYSPVSQLLPPERGCAALGGGPVRQEQRDHSVKAPRPVGSGCVRQYAMAFAQHRKQGPADRKS